MDIEKIDRKYEEIRNKYLETQIRDNELIDKAISFFNSYYKLSEHPFTLEDINIISNISFSIKMDFLHWSVFSPKTNEEIVNFYRNTPFEFFKNLLKNMDIMHYQVILAENILPALKKNNLKTILDYGGGSGYMSILLSKLGYKVTFSEINKLSIEWMRYITKELKYDIDVIDLYEQKLESRYDTILVKDVLEHVLDTESMLNTLSKSTGYLIIIPDKVENNEDYLPQHFPYKIEQ